MDWGESRFLWNDCVSYKQQLAMPGIFSAHGAQVFVSIMPIGVVTIPYIEITSGRFKEDNYDRITLTGCTIFADQIATTAGEPNRQLDH